MFERNPLAVKSGSSSRTGNSKPSGGGKLNRRYLRCVLLAAWLRNSRFEGFCSSI